MIFFLPCRFSRFRAHWPSAKNRIFSDFAFASFFLVFQQLNSHGSRLSVLDWFQSRADCWDFVFFFGNRFSFCFFFGSPFSLRKSFVSFWSESLFTRRPLRRRCFLEGFLAVWRFKENNGPDWPLRFIFLNKNGAGGPVRSNTFPFGDLRTVSFFLGGGRSIFIEFFQRVSTDNSRTPTHRWMKMWARFFFFHKMSCISSIECQRERRNARPLNGSLHGPLHSTCNNKLFFLK